MRRTRRMVLGAMMLSIPFATAACSIPIGPCTLKILEGPTTITCTF